MRNKTWNHKRFGYDLKTNLWLILFWFVQNFYVPKLQKICWHANWANSILNWIDPVPYFSQLSCELSQSSCHRHAKEIIVPSQWIDQVADLVDPLYWVDSAVNWANPVITYPNSNSYYLLSISQPSSRCGRPTKVSWLSLGMSRSSFRTEIFFAWIDYKIFIKSKLF